MAVRVSCLCGCMLPLKVAPAAGSRCAWHSWIALSVKDCVIGAFFPTDDSKLDLVAAGKRGHLKWHADIRRTLLSTHIREASVKRSLTFPTTLLSPSKTPVTWLHESISGPECSHYWPGLTPRARVCSVTTRTGPPENLLRRYCGYSSVWIYLRVLSLRGFTLHAKAGARDGKTADFSAKLYSFRHSNWWVHLIFILYFFYHGWAVCYVTGDVLVKFDMCFMCWREID